MRELREAGEVEHVFHRFHDPKISEPDHLRNGADIIRVCLRRQKPSINVCAIDDEESDLRGLAETLKGTGLSGRFHGFVFRPVFGQSAEAALRQIVDHIRALAAGGPSNGAPKHIADLFGDPSGFEAGTGPSIIFLDQNLMRSSSTKEYIKPVAELIRLLRHESDFCVRVRTRESGSDPDRPALDKGATAEELVSFIYGSIAEDFSFLAQSDSGVKGSREFVALMESFVREVNESGNRVTDLLESDSRR